MRAKNQKIISNKSLGKNQISKTNTTNKTISLKLKNNGEGKAKSKSKETKQTKNVVRSKSKPGELVETYNLNLVNNMINKDNNNKNSFHINNIKKKKINSKYLYLLVLVIINIFLYVYKKKYLFKKPEYKLDSQIGNFEIDEIYPEDYERNILEKIKDKLKGPMLMGFDEFSFINGLIRKYKPKKLLEIGVCSGGMSAAILNAIYDREDTFLYSCDLETKHYLNSNYEIGCVVKDNFPQFMKKWKLYTGNTTAAFIEEIGNDIDFVFIDTAHVMPGEVLNIIEILPFLKQNAIIAFDDIDHQFRESLYNVPDFYPCNNLLFSVLRGKKIIFNQKKNNLFNYRKLGAVILDNNQENYFFEYFYLLTNNWSYMPNKFEIDTIRK